MARVYCAEIECKHNRDGSCRAKEVNFRAGLVHTVHQGRKRIWECRMFEQDPEIAAMWEDLRKYLGTMEVVSESDL